MMNAAIMWGMVCLGAFWFCDMYALVYPEFVARTLAAAVLGVIGVFGFTRASGRPTREALGWAFAFLFPCGFLLVSIPIYSPVMEGLRADQEVRARYPVREGEGDEAYCARLVPVLRESDRFLRIGAARRLKTCGAAGRPALPQLALASEDPDLRFRRAAEEARAAIEAEPAAAGR